MSALLKLYKFACIYVLLQTSPSEPVRAGQYAAGCVNRKREKEKERWKGVCVCVCGGCVCEWCELIVKQVLNEPAVSE